MGCEYKSIDDTINKTNSYDGIKQQNLGVIDSNGYANHVPLENLKTHYKKLQVDGPLFLQMFQRSPMKQFSTQNLQTEGNLKPVRPSPSLNRTYNPLMGSNAIHYLTQKLQQCAISDVAVMRIKSMFPTVNESHIKALLHKYHYREAVVISALQVEKHPLTTPGPHSSPIAAAAHLSSRMCTSFASTPNRYISVSPLYGLSPKAVRSSPKMKLRYLKSIFPVVEDTILVEALSNSKNNVNTAAESLMKKGYDKSNKQQSSKKSEGIKVNDDKQQIIIPLHEPIPKKTEVDKKEIEKKFAEKYEKIEKEIVKLALESAEYNEKRAEHLLSSCEPKYSKIKIKCDTTEGDETDSTEATRSTRICDCYSSHTTSPIYATAPAFPPIVPDKVPKAKNVLKIRREPTLDKTTIAYETQINDYDYKEDIATRNEKQTKETRTKGPNKNLLGQRCIAKGPKSDNRNGPVKGLAKGSIYKSYERKRQNKSNKCNIS